LQIQLLLRRRHAAGQSSNVHGEIVNAIALAEGPPPGGPVNTTT
jgi:hypothetical protein